MKTIYKILVSLLIMILLIAAIFFFSEQSGTDSHSISRKISFRVAKTWTDAVSVKRPEDTVDYLAYILEQPIRKLAHVCIYTLLGFGSCIVVHILCGRKIRFWHLFVCILTVALVAALDEFNQYYTVGRGSSFKDVLIDIFGGCIGIYLLFMVKDFIRHFRNGILRG